MLFPFLIGTVRTKNCRDVVWYTITVSIPHRYGKNDDTYDEIRSDLQTFPFLIGTVRTNIFDKGKPGKGSFHSS